MKMTVPESYLADEISYERKQVKCQTAVKKSQ